MLLSSLGHRVDDVENAYKLRYVNGPSVQWTHPYLLRFDNLQTDHDDKKSVSEKHVTVA